MGDHFQEHLHIDKISDRVASGSVLYDQRNMERHYTTRISEHLIYHVFFPPKLPQEACDDDLEQDINTQLINSILETISIYQLNELQRQEQWGRMRKMLESVAHHVGVPFEAEKLREELAELQVGGRYKHVLDQPQAKYSYFYRRFGPSYSSPKCRGARS